MTVVFDWSHNNKLEVRFVGAVSGEDLIASVLKFSGDARFDDIRVITCDWSEYTLSDSKVELQDIEQLAAITVAMAKTNPKVKLEVVLMSKNLEQRGAFANIFEVLTKDTSWGYASFDTLKEAQEWVEPKKRKISNAR